VLKERNAGEIRHSVFFCARNGLRPYPKLLSLPGLSGQPIFLLQEKKLGRPDKPGNDNV
jgi:hypothetical protein